MADLSKPDIVKNCSVGRGLDDSRNTYSSVCAELNHSESSNVVQQLSADGEMLRPVANPSIYIKIMVCLPDEPASTSGVRQAPKLKVPSRS
jgi:hypothetical protein